MATLSRDQLYQYGAAAGFTGGALDEVVAIALAESSGDTQHVNVNGPDTINGKSVSSSRDRGVLQINDIWNPDVSDAQAFDPTFSFQWAYKVTQGGQANLFQAYWVTVQNGAYKQYLTAGSSGATGTTGTTTGLTMGVPMIDLTPITSWLTSLNSLWDWLRNPIRLIKLLVGLGLVVSSILLLLSPEAEEVVEAATGLPDALPKDGKDDE